MVLDSSALLILLRGEAGHERVAKSLEVNACMTSVSLTVVLAALPHTTLEAYSRTLVGSA
jgi:PIN domain nuclease of toxin-antitoxin system